MSEPPNAPLCEMKAMRPRAGAVGECRLRLDEALHIPLQFGPTKRMPASLAAATISAWRCSPSTPLSAKPALMTTAARMPFAPHSRSTRGAAAAGTVTTARSIDPGTSSTEGYARCPMTSSAVGWTG